MSTTSDPARLQELAGRAQVQDSEVEFYRALARVDPYGVTGVRSFLEFINNLGIWLRELGRRDEALAAVEEAVKVWRTLAHDNPPAFAPNLAGSLSNLGVMLRDLGRRDEALVVAEEALDLYRALAHANAPAFTPSLAMSLNNLGTMLRDLGRREEALAATEEAVKLYRALPTFTPDLARSLSNLGVTLSDLGRREEALAAEKEAVTLFRALYRDNPQALDPDLVARSLKILRPMRSDLGRREQALAAAKEAEDPYRAIAHDNARVFAPELATSLHNLGINLDDLGRREEALAAAEEAVKLRRALVRYNPLAFTPDLAGSLNSLGVRLSEHGRREEALAALRECAAHVLQLRPDEPHWWSGLCLASLRHLDTPQDLRTFHLPLLRLLTEHREMAWNSEHAEVFLDLQTPVAARVWELLATLPAEDGDLLDEAIAALVATLHSPDLSRWLEARGSGDGPLAKLAELKRKVIEAEQLLAALRKGLPGGGDAGWRADWSGPGTEAQRAALIHNIEHQATQAQARRQAFRDERARLVAEDPRFGAAFEPIGLQALRAIAGHARGGALLCVLELGSNGTAGQPEPSLAERRRSVAALLYADGRRTQRLELAGVHELAWHAQKYRPEALGVNRRGPLRGAPAVVHSLADDSSPPPISDLLGPRMSQSFWTPLQQALQAAGVAIERLHVCLHGTTQQLPLALRQAGDCPGLQVVPWPGLPYLRRAAMATTVDDTANAASAPWLIGHDCAWGSAQPLPMVAVEAALLRDLLQRHGRPVQAIQRAAQLHGQASALVTCCHGGTEQVQFDHALHLGTESLTVRKIMQENIGPPLALLPACHAGRTDEDWAGNALGVAAAFMLSGTKVVVASSKAVPDLLQPWLSTLTVWHALQGRPHHEAATLAREQFARLNFPEAYRSWLQEALPQALATIQPGGEEDRHIRGVHALVAREKMQERWPWEGDTQHLFHADRSRRANATRSVVEGILRPRGGDAVARGLAAEAREMAAFVFVYGVAQSGPGQGVAGEAAASAEPSGAARVDGPAVHSRAAAGIAPSAAPTAGAMATPPVPDQHKTTHPTSSLLRRLRALVGR